ncbi:UbiA prenyltransferase family-domain-containing protein [Cadophora sp. MPI-SDFR-AT-0126]|nr:UbiA prenyltransferase family-domain-containing protein [Leotiomycetes sp. MPI-SDFR-AT-0126]
MEDKFLNGVELPLQTKKRGILFHAKTIYLITKSDIKTTMLPATTFAFTAAFSGLFSANSLPKIRILSGLQKSIFWTWMNLWIFNLANQRLPDAIAEDSINKPWRAIPSGRLTSKQARQILLASIPIVLFSTLYIGGSKESIFLMILTWMYNDLGAAEETFIVRNISNALGFISFGAGAAQVACGPLDMTAYYWSAVITAAITCTIQFQDMEDQEGDRARGRKTMPIVLGDSFTRLVNAHMIMLFSFVAPAFWQLPFTGFLLPLLLGLLIASKTLLRTDLMSDKQTFRLWCLWLMVLYVLPMARDREEYSVPA